jgi:hypothetical protein
MVRGGHRCLLGFAALGVLGALAGCGGRYLMAEREPWRHEAEVECMNSGAVREGPGKVRISAIEGPGACGMDLPLKVASLGYGGPMSYLDDPRPPSAIPGAEAPPRWPIAQPRTAVPVAGAVTREDLPVLGSDRPRPLPPPARYPPPPRYGSPWPDQPMPLDPPSNRAGAAPELYDFRKPYEGAHTPVPSAPPPRSALASAGPVGVSPPATLACPLVSALDEWIDEAVQPAALKWFGAPVIEIKQISAYSCRGMNGDPNATISEHAFGNALDIAAFILADGRKVTVQYGWHGAPQEQAFLHDVQFAACNQFTTVLAPGSNAFHYNHMHVDLMRRQSGRRACNPQAVSGDEIAARLGVHLAARPADPAVTGSVKEHRTAAPAKPVRPSAYAARRSDRDLPDAVPGADGEK